MKLSDTQIMYVRSMGKALRVTAVFTSDDEANAYMHKNKNEGVIACFGNLVLLANIYDKGVTIND